MEKSEGRGKKLPSSRTHLAQPPSSSSSSHRFCLFVVLAPVNRAAHTLARLREAHSMPGLLHFMTLSAAQPSPAGPCTYSCQSEQRLTGATSDPVVTASCSGTALGRKLPLGDQPGCLWGDKPAARGRAPGIAVRVGCWVPIAAGSTLKGGSGCVWKSCCFPESKGSLPCCWILKATFLPADSCRSAVVPARVSLLVLQPVSYQPPEAPPQSSCQAVLLHVPQSHSATRGWCWDLC